MFKYRNELLKANLTKIEQQLSDFEFECFTEEDFYKFFSLMFEPECSSSDFELLTEHDYASICCNNQILSSHFNNKDFIKEFIREELQMSISFEDKSYYVAELIAKIKILNHQTDVIPF